VRSEILDAFEDLSDWMPVASGLAELRISSERGPRGAVMRLDFDFKGGGGFVVARRSLARAMPESYALSFAIRGAAPANRLELKLADPSGRNVWWRHWDAFDFAAEWQTLSVRSSEIEFAWGPAGGGALAQLGAIELVIAAGPGGAGRCGSATCASRTVPTGERRASPRRAPSRDTRRSVPSTETRTRAGAASHPPDPIASRSISARGGNTAGS
jgi:hypothetical protein